MSSSGLGFGHGSLDRDTQEISDLLQYLIHHRGAQNFAFVGHSTGCQNSVHFLKYGNKDLVEKIKVIALQAPVSDREDAMTRPEYQRNIAHAKALVESGKEEEMMPRNSFWAPITASRFLSLQDIGGDDDFFSSDFSDDELKLRLGHIANVTENSGLKTLVAFSGEDEYVPDHIDKKQLLDRLCMAMRKDGAGAENDCHVIPLMLELGNHNLSNDDGNDKQIFVQSVKDLLWQVLN
jgi:pimeloyl-ACP methyl ester carboxylesterase